MDFGWTHLRVVLARFVHPTEVFLALDAGEPRLFFFQVIITSPELPSPSRRGSLFFQVIINKSRATDRGPSDRGFLCTGAMTCTPPVDSLWCARFLPSALNVKVNQARVNGGSNRDSLKGALQRAWINSIMKYGGWKIQFNGYNFFDLFPIANCTL